jgi:NagD protein
MNYEEKLAELRTKKGIISDMDGVIYHGNQILPGVREFVDWLYREKKEFLFLTNASERTPLELKQKLARMGLDVDESHFYTSAMATAKFLDQQAPGCSAYVIGSAGLLNALHDVGITMNDVNPDYVVVGETSAYNFMMLTKAMQLVEAELSLLPRIQTLAVLGETGNIPACKALVAPLELTTGRQAYFVGKPNPLIMRTGLKLLGVHSAEAAMIGDNMNTDIIAGIETGLMSVLVLSGVSTKEGIKNYAYQPNLILNNVGEIVPKKV